MGRERKKRRTHVVPTADSEQARAPKSFVFKTGKVGKSVQALTMDFRTVMEPNTASKLRERTKNKLSDFVAVAGQLGVTHFAVFARTEVGTTLRLCRFPRGPTFTFRVNSYSLRKDVLESQQKPRSPSIEYQSAPLLVMNGFGGNENHISLTTTMLRNMFPAINVKTMKLTDARRVVLLNRDPETGVISFRHYIITTRDVGVSKSVKRLGAAAKPTSKLPDLSQFRDVSDYVLREAYFSESDVEDGPDSLVELPGDKRRGKRRVKSKGKAKVREGGQKQKAVRLVEVGPRMELSLMKIQKDLAGGEVLYHSIVKKTPQEVRDLEERIRKRDEERARRKAEQDANVQRKKAEKEEHRKRTGAKPESNDEDAEEDAEEEKEDGDDAPGADDDEDMDDEMAPFLEERIFDQVMQQSRRSNKRALEQDDDEEDGDEGEEDGGDAENDDDEEDDDDEDNEYELDEPQNVRVRYGDDDDDSDSESDDEVNHAEAAEAAAALGTSSKPAAKKQPAPAAAGKAKPKAPPAPAASSKPRTISFSSAIPDDMDDEGDDEGDEDEAPRAAPSKKSRGAAKPRGKARK